MRGLLHALFFVAALVASTARVEAEDVATLKVASSQLGAWDTAIADLGQRRGIFRKHGLLLEILYASGCAESQQAVVAGHMDIAVACGIGSVLGWYEKGAPIRVIGAEMTGSPDLYWYVPAGSPIKNRGDLTGRTIAYSVNGSSTHSAALEFLHQANLAAKLVSTGGLTGTLTQAMTGQVDVGWAAAPFGFDQVDQGKIRIVFRGSDIDALRNRTTRVNVTSTRNLETRRTAIEQFVQAYRETVDWMYSDPDAINAYSELSKLPIEVARKARDFIPKSALNTDQIMGLEESVADAERMKFISKAMTHDQLKELLQMPSPSLR